MKSLENSPSILISLTELQEKTRADSIILWLYQEFEEALIATLCPSLPEMKGFQQKLDTGIISQSFVAGLPILETHLKKNSLHDPTFDNSSGRDCKSLMACPVAFEENFVGVLSAAMFENMGESESRDFSEVDLKFLSLFGQSLEKKLQND